MSLVRLPAVVTSADDVLTAAQQLIDDETASFDANPKINVSCRPQCNACCDHAVPVTAAEMRAIAAAVALLPIGTQQAIFTRAREVYERIAAEIPAAVSEFPRRYYALREPCPLLIDGVCSVREVRPLACREYLTTSAPEHCDDRSLGQAVRIRRRKDVTGWFNTVSARFNETAPRLLATALLDPVEAPQETSLSGPKLARLLTSKRTVPHPLAAVRPGS